MVGWWKGLLALAGSAPLVEEAAAGGGAAQAGQPLLPLPPLKPAGQANRYKLLATPGCVDRGPAHAGVADVEATSRDHRHTCSAANRQRLLKQPRPLTPHTATHPSRSAPMQTSAPVVVGELLARPDVVARKEHEAVAAAHAQDLGVEGGRARVVLHVWRPTEASECSGAALSSADVGCRGCVSAAGPNPAQPPGLQLAVSLRSRPPAHPSTHREAAEGARFSRVQHVLVVQVEQEAVAALQDAREEGESRFERCQAAGCWSPSYT